MNRSADSPTGLTEFGPLTPDEKPQGYGFSFSKLFKRAVRGGSREKSGIISDHQHEQQDGQASGKNADQISSRSNSINDGGPSWLVDKGIHDNVSECSDTSSVASSASSLLRSGSAVSSGHDRTLPNVLTRIRNIIDNRGSTPQQYKDSDFKQYWLPDSTSVQCYECEEKFTTFRRRHHCRVCGQIFCSRCCNSMIPGKIIGYTGEE
ncbi:hypothetical protein SK128_019117 [Halocaridina rubra]|uniref:FYVE-type domain-containing protein n=1 Tax=Halocaridina rubra TaxID=373956 RepID=A0AAN8XHC6_HALRR